MSKRNQNKVKANRRKKTAAYLEGNNGKSRYARKVASGKQMYGPGCCANELARQSLRERRTS